MEEFNLEDGGLTGGFLDVADELAPLREFVMGQKKALEQMGFSEESSDKMAAKIWEFYIEGMITEMRKQVS